MDLLGTFSVTVEVKLVSAGVTLSRTMQNRWVACLANGSPSTLPIATPAEDIAPTAPDSRRDWCANQVSGPAA